MNKVRLILLFVFCMSAVQGQKLTVLQYIDTYKDLAIKEMKRTGVPASITIAQGILETESGNSWLVLQSNNHFGIKCKSTWTGETVYHDDDARGECFRKYNTAEESFRDHSDFLKTRSHYAFLFSIPPDDYKGWAHGLKKAGYATNPKYPQMLINSIEKYKLHQYTLKGKEEMLFEEQTLAVDSNEKVIAIAPVIQMKPAIINTSGNKRSSFLGIPAIFALKNTSLLAIAIEHDIPLAKLLEYNELSKDGLLEQDKWIFLDKKHKEGQNEFFIVKDERTLSDVARASAVQLKYLEEFNNLRAATTLKTGTKILLKPAKLVRDSDDLAFQKVHNVLPKEGLYTISKKYNVSVAEIKTWNRLESDNLKVGQQLIILK